MRLEESIVHIMTIIILLLSQSSVRPPLVTNHAQMRVSAKHARDGRISARFYTDSWPEFSTVVAQITTPRLSEVNHIPSPA